MLKERERSRLLQCQSRLKRLGESVQKFHEVQHGLPPATIGNVRPSLFMLLTPYCEHEIVWNIISSKSNDCELPINGTWWKTLTNDEQNKIDNIPIFNCPARRSNNCKHKSKNFNKTKWNNGNDRPLGPLCDYAIPMSRGYAPNNPKRYLDSSFDNNGNSWETKWDKCWDPVDPKHYHDHHGPFRVAFVEDNSNNKNGKLDYRNWHPRDDFSRFVDGASNQIIIGEKHIPISRINQCNNPFPDGHIWDCGILSSGNNGRQISFVRGLENTGEIQQILVRESDAFSNGHPFQYSFGSAHPNSCLFLFGDGTVKSGNVWWSPLVICQLGVVDDGKPHEENID
ncbi:MAG: DUF1559 domain-containing protein [Planctomycetaceae bacterium]|nr:DUF1559 domain-containing protein [Planctomycetaceae bacterium]